MNLPRFASCAVLLALATFAPSAARAANEPAPKPADVHEAIVPSLLSNEVAGVVTLVVTPDRIVHLGAQGWADLAGHEPM